MSYLYVKLRAANDTIISLMATRQQGAAFLFVNIFLKFCFSIILRNSSLTHVVVNILGADGAEGQRRVLFALEKVVESRAWLVTLVRSPTSSVLAESEPRCVEEFVVGDEALKEELATPANLINGSLLRICKRWAIFVNWSGSSV